MATKMIDIGLTDTADAAIAAGDFTTTESTGQHQKQLILNNKGDFKQNPSLCVGVFEYFDDEQMQNLVRAISVEFTKDGMNVKSVLLDQAGVINTDAYYP
jgi:hypothetical protein